jgi:hypothetical protein
MIVQFALLLSEHLFVDAPLRQHLVDLSHLKFALVHLHQQIHLLHLKLALVHLH